MAETTGTVHATAVNIPTTTPTTIATVTSPDAMWPNNRIECSFNITTGAGTTAIVVKCFDEFGIQVGVNRTITVGAAVSADYFLAFVDSRGYIPPVSGFNNSVTGTPGGIPRNLYTVQVTQTAATGNGTVNEVNAWINGTN